MNLLIGRDRESGNGIDIDTSRSHVIFISGKRGSGKSYTVGVIAEELYLKSKEIIPIIIDSMGIYWTMAVENDQENLYEWNLSPQALPVRLLVPGNPKVIFDEELLTEMEYRGIDVTPIWIPPSDIEPDEWLDLFGFSLTDPMGIALYRATSALYTRKVDEGYRFTMDDIVKEVTKDEYAHDRTKIALISRLDVAKRWGIFRDAVWKTLDLFHEGTINIIDLSHLDPTRYGLRQFITMIICKKLFAERLRARRKEELGRLTDTPRIWLLIDEAQHFIPSGKSTTSKPVLIRWVKEGRQPGLSIVLSTQQPSALDSEVLSQCDTIIAHRITMKMDIDALNALSQDYMKLEFKQYLKKVKNPGQAIFLDDEKESINIVKIRGRVSRHGGREILWYP